MKIKLITTLFAMILTLTVFSQKRMDAALNGFLGTEFMTKFKEMKDRAENAATEFKMNQDNYPREDVVKVQQAYTRTSDKFNIVLENVKADFLDRKKLKFIAEYPDTYSKGLELEMYKLSDYYAQNFQQVLADVTGDQVDGSIILLIGEIITLTKDVVDYIAKMKRAAKQFTVGYLNEKLINPNAFKTWNDLPGGNLAAKKPKKEEEYEEEEYEEEGEEEEEEEYEEEYR